MRLLSKSREFDLEEGSPADVAAKKAAQIREYRLQAARRNSSHWTELAETDFVRRGRWLVHVDSDELFSVYRGAIFGPGSGGIDFNHQIEMTWYVDRNGDLVFLEKSRAPRTWSEIVRRKALRGAS